VGAPKKRGAFFWRSPHRLAQGRPMRRARAHPSVLVKAKGIFSDALRYRKERMALIFRRMRIGLAQENCA